MMGRMLAGGERVDVILFFLGRLAGWLARLAGWLG
jgi:hypothetical protein